MADCQENESRTAICGWLKSELHTAHRCSQLGLRGLTHLASGPVIVQVHFGSQFVFDCPAFWFSPVCRVGKLPGEALAELGVVATPAPLKVSVGRPARCPAAAAVEDGAGAAAARHRVHQRRRTVRVHKRLLAGSCQRRDDTRHAPCSYNYQTQRSVFSRPFP